MNHRAIKEEICYALVRSSSPPAPLTKPDDSRLWAESLAALQVYRGASTADYSKGPIPPHLQYSDKVQEYLATRVATNQPTTVMDTHTTLT